LAQLHQLRGRVGRGAEQSYCLLVSRPKEQLTDSAVARLEALVRTTDGFELAGAALDLGEAASCSAADSRGSRICGSRACGRIVRCSSAPAEPPRSWSATTARWQTRSTAASRTPSRRRSARRVGDESTQSKHGWFHTRYRFRVTLNAWGNLEGVPRGHIFRA